MNEVNSRLQEKFPGDSLGEGFCEDVIVAMGPRPKNSPPLPLQKFGRKGDLSFRGEKQLCYSKSVLVTSSHVDNSKPMNFASSDKNPEITVNWDDDDPSHTTPQLISSSMLRSPSNNLCGDKKFPVTSMLFHHQYDGSPDGEAGGTKCLSRKTEVALSDEAHTHHLTTYDPLYSSESFPKGISKLGTPVLNSSRIFQIALDSFDDKFDRDDFSVSTVVTSKSMMLRAAAVASNVSKDVNIYDYENIIPLRIEDHELGKRLLARNSTTVKHLDSAWLMRKQNLCPASDDVRVLQAPDPYIPVVLSRSTTVGGDLMPILTRGDECAFTWTYDLNIFNDEIFGDVDAKKGLCDDGLNQRTRFNWQCCFQDMLDIVGMC